MTHRLDVGCGQLLAGRWQRLAEQRLEYLTELFENGRWRRYYSERAFLENIREAKAAVGSWRKLARGPAEAEFAASDEALSAPAVDLLALEQALKTAAPAIDTGAMEQRYPLLHNAF
jgi:uncharacterized repeat protein (TIGR03809 family)